LAGGLASSWKLGESGNDTSEDALSEEREEECKRCANRDGRDVVATG